MLDQWRQEIDELDHALMDILNTRFNLVESIGHYKIAQGQPIQNHIRESEQAEKWTNHLMANRNNPYILRIMKIIVNESRQRQSDIKKGEEQYENSLL